MPGNLVASQGILGTSIKREASFGSVLGEMSAWTALRCDWAAMAVPPCTKHGLDKARDCSPTAATASPQELPYQRIALENQSCLGGVGHGDGSIARVPWPPPAPRGRRP